MKKLSQTKTTRWVEGKVSVCVPSYNHSRFIKQNLESIFAQTYRPIELVVIDDGSSDGSPEVIEEVLKHCPFPSKFISQPNKGLARTLNEGLDLSDGEFFAGLASDDVWFPDFLATRVRQLSARPTAVLAYGNCRIIDADGSVTGSTDQWATYDDGNAREMLLTRYPPSSPSVLYRRSALDVYRWCPGATVEDLDVYLRLSTLGEFAFDPSALSAWRIHGTNTTKNTRLMVAGAIAALERNAEIIGLTDIERRRFLESVEWSAAESFYQAGNRSEAIKLAVNCLKSSFPLSEKIRLIGKLLSPRSFVNLRRRIKYGHENRSWENIKGLQ